MKFLFLVSHLYSESYQLFDILDQNPRIQGYRYRTSFNHPDALNPITSIPHKTKKINSIYMGEVLFNSDLSHKSFFEFSKFIYFIREPKNSLNSLVQNGYNIMGALSYYFGRLQRIFEMMHYSNSIILTYDNLFDGIATKKIKNYLDTDIKIEGTKRDMPNVIDYDIIKLAQEKYEKYLYCYKKISN